MRLNDAMEFYKFLDLCLKKLVMKKSSSRQIVTKYFLFIGCPTKIQVQKEQEKEVSDD